MSASATAAKSAPQNLRAIMDKQRAAYLKDGPPSAEIRIDRLNRCIGLLVDHQDEIADALNKDFGNRSPQMSKFTDVSGSIGPLKHARDNKYNNIAIVVLDGRGSLKASAAEDGTS